MDQSQIRILIDWKAHDREADSMSKGVLLITLTSGQADMAIGDLGLYEPIPNSKDYLVSHATKLEKEVLVTGQAHPP